MRVVFFINKHASAERAGEQLADLDLEAVPRRDETVHLPDQGDFVVWQVVWRLDQDEGLRYAMVTVVTVDRYFWLYQNRGMDRWLMR